MTMYTRVHIAKRLCVLRNFKINYLKNSTLWTVLFLHVKYLGLIFLLFFNRFTHRLDHDRGWGWGYWCCSRRGVQMHANEIIAWLLRILTVSSTPVWISSIQRALSEISALHRSYEYQCLHPHLRSMLYVLLFPRRLSLFTSYRYD